MSEQWNRLAGRCIETPDGIFYLTYGKDRCGNPHFRDFAKLDKIAYQVAALPQLVEALEWALDDPDSDILGEEWAKAAQAAIAKAKGE